MTTTCPVIRPMVTRQAVVCSPALSALVWSGVHLPARRSDVRTLAEQLPRASGEAIR